MNTLQYLSIKKNQDFYLKIIKIILIGFVSFSLFASAIPFYLGYDDVNYGLSAINLSKGKFGVTNELLRETDYQPGGVYYQFVPNAYVQTERDVAIPKSSVGIHAIGSLFYLVGGFLGIFYFGPIITIALIILFERISTKLFGNLVGLLALLFLIADWQIFFVGLRFLTDNIFSLFFILGVFSLIKFLHQKNERYILLSSTFFTIATFFRINGIVFLPIEVFIITSYFMVPYLKKIPIFNWNKSNSEVILTKKAFSKFKIRYFSKIISFLLIPWIIFIVFWVSSNAYYFSDPGTNYQEQMQDITKDDVDAPSIEETPQISKPNEEVQRNEFQRLQLIQYYSVPLLPDPLYFFSVIVSDTDLEIWRSDIWISYITFSIIVIVLIFSLYFKIKRTETLVFLLFISGIVIFYSSPLVTSDPLASNLSEHANNRYTIPISLLSFTLFGFILVEVWHKFFSKNHVLYKKILYSLKLTYIIMIAAFFLALIATMPSLQDFYQTGFHFNNPFVEAQSFEDLEKLPDKSLIVSFIGRNSLLHTDTHFFPYGRDFVLSEGDVDTIPKSKIATLLIIMEEEGHDAYTYKNNMYFYDQKYFEFLEAEHGIVLKDYSKTFCKLELVSNLDEDIVGISSDSICFQDIIKGDKKLRTVTLKWPP